MLGRSTQGNFRKERGLTSPKTRWEKKEKAFISFKCSHCEGKWKWLAMYRSNSFYWCMLFYDLGCDDRAKDRLNPQQTGILRYLTF